MKCNKNHTSSSNRMFARSPLMNPTMINIANPPANPLLYKFIKPCKLPTCITIGRCSAPAAIPAHTPNRPGQRGKGCAKQGRQQRSRFGMRPNIGDAHQIHPQHDRQNIAGMLAQRAKRIHGENTRQRGAIYIAAHIMNIPEGNQPDHAHIDQCRPQVRDLHKIGCQTPAVVPDLAIPLQTAAP